MNLDALGLSLGSQQANDVAHHDREVGPRSLVVGVAHHAKEVLRCVASHVRALLDEGQRFFGWRLVRPFQGDLSPAGDRAQLVRDLVGDASCEVGGGGFGLHALGHRAFVCADQQGGTAGSLGEREHADTGARCNGCLGPRTGVLDDRTKRVDIRVAEERAGGLEQPSGYSTSETLQGFDVRADCVTILLEEREAELVCYPTN